MDGDRVYWPPYFKRMPLGVGRGEACSQRSHGGGGVTASGFSPPPSGPTGWYRWNSSAK